MSESYFDSCVRQAMARYQSYGIDQLVNVIRTKCESEESTAARRLLEARMTADQSIIPVVLDKLNTQIIGPSISAGYQSAGWNAFINTLEIYARFGGQRELDSCFTYLDRIKASFCSAEGLRNAGINSVIRTIEQVATRLERKDILERLARLVQCYPLIQRCMDYGSSRECQERLMAFKPPSWLDRHPRVQRLLRMGQGPS